MIVEPVTVPSDKASELASESIWIPPGEWIEWQTGKRFTGPLIVRRNFSVQQTPVYVRAGSIIPMAPRMRWSGEKPLDPLIMNIFPLADGQSSSYDLYEDAGNSRAYRVGEAARTVLSASQKSSDLNIEVAPAQGNYAGMATTRAYELRLPGDWPPDSVTVNHQPLEYSARKGKVAGATKATPSRPSF